MRVPAVNASSWPRDVTPTHDYEECQKDVSDRGHHLDHWFVNTAGVSGGEVSVVR